MGALESASMVWTFSTLASTGAVGLKAFNAQGISERFTVIYEAGTGSSATLRMETAMGSSSATYVPVTGTSTAVSTSVSLQQFAGPLEWIRPYATVKSTGALTVRLMGN
jgi:hypothetical protein